MVEEIGFKNIARKEEYGIELYKDRWVCVYCQACSFAGKLYEIKDDAIYLCPSVITEIFYDKKGNISSRNFVTERELPVMIEKKAIQAIEPVRKEHLEQLVGFTLNELDTQQPVREDSRQ